jgi:hypothetical protein
LFLAPFDVEEESHSSDTWSRYRTRHRPELKWSIPQCLCGMIDIYIDLVMYRRPLLLLLARILLATNVMSSDLLK